jgi:tetratricopeptide (TPR) repeat protein
MRVSALLILCAAATLIAEQSPSGTRDRAMPPYRQGLVALRTESWDSAANAFQHAIDIDATFEMAYYGLGRARMGQKRYAQAVVSLTKCKDLFQSQAGRQFSNRQDAQRYRQDRINEIDELIRQYQQGPQTIRSQDAVRQLEQARRDIRDQFERGMNITVNKAVPAYVLLALGSAFFREEQFADAEREYKAALEMDPRIGEAYNNLAVVYLQTGRYREAMDAVTAAEKAGFKVHPQLKLDIKSKVE